MCLQIKDTVINYGYKYKLVPIEAVDSCSVKILYIEERANLN